MSSQDITGQKATKKFRLVVEDAYGQDLDCVLAESEIAEDIFLDDRMKKQLAKSVLFIVTLANMKAHGREGEFYRAVKRQNPVLVKFFKKLWDSLDKMEL